MRRLNNSVGKGNNEQTCGLKARVTFSRGDFLNQTQLFRILPQDKSFGTFCVLE